MKRSNYLTRFITLLLFVFLLVYFTGMIIQAVQNPVRTAPAVLMDMEEGFTTPGMIVREEYVIAAQYPVLSSLVHDGERVSVGMAYLSAYATQADRERNARIRMLEEEIAQLESQRTISNTAAQRAELETEIRRNLRDLGQSTRSGDFASLESQTIRLRALALVGNEEGTSERLAQIQSELATLQAQGVSVSHLSAYRTGVYSSRIDGFEHLNIDAVMEMSRDDLTHTLERTDILGSEAYAGKLIISTTWHYVTLVPEEEYDALYSYYAGQRPNRLMVRFGNMNPVPMQIYHLGQPEDGYVKLILSSTTALADTINIRHVQATITYRTIGGIRIPREALRFGEVEEETGHIPTYVYTLAVNIAEQKFVEVLYEGEDFFLVAADMVRSSAAGALREGNTVIVRARNLYDGRIVQR